MLTLKTIKNNVSLFVVKVISRIMLEEKEKKKHKYLSLKNRKKITSSVLY